MIGTTSVKVAVDTPAPPYSFGTVIPQRPLCENHSISSNGSRRSLSRAAESGRICSAMRRAASSASWSLLIRCASAISSLRFEFVHRAASHHKPFRLKQKSVTQHRFQRQHLTRDFLDNVQAGAGSSLRQRNGARESTRKNHPTRISATDQPTKVNPDSLGDFARKQASYDQTKSPIQEGGDEHRNNCHNDRTPRRGTERRDPTQERSNRPRGRKRIPRYENQQHLERESQNAEQAGVPPRKNSRQ